ncbi:MAG: hypothetical protein MPK62_11530 [Alphaproteobacteria bacterium]|nr:hypothetical protein [Alphaproteobacteria bacterium]
MPSSFAVDNIAPLAIISGTVSSDTNFSKLVNGITNNDAEWNVTGESGTTIVFDWTNIYTNAIFIFFDNLTGCCLTTNLSLSLSSNGMNNYNASITAKQSIISNPIPNNIGFNRVVFTLPPADTANAGRLSLREIRIYADRK